MTKEQLWSIYIKRNPQFLIDGANFTADGLLKFFNQVFDEGVKYGFDKPRVAKGNGMVPDFMKGMFT